HRSAPAPFASVNIMALPPGSSCGPCANSLVFTETMVSGLPPFAETRRMPAGPAPNRIWSSEVQLAPYGSWLSQIVTDAPPVIAIFLILFSAAEWNPIQRPSGEKNG